MLRQTFGERVGLVHGKQKAAERDAAMAAFAAGDLDILVATTVIEVGVNVPEATVMVVEHAERFGLAQLHQLRGRVGRGAAKSNCVLLYQAPLGETAKARLQILRETEDGFRIAEEDLRLRGGGELLGTRQSGLPGFHYADLAVHGDLLAMARDDARLIVERDPQLKSERGEALRMLLYLFRQDLAIKTPDVWLAGSAVASTVGVTMPPETTSFSPSSIGILRRMMSCAGTNSRNPEVGFGVVGTNTLITSSARLLLHFALAGAGDEAERPDALARILDQHALAERRRLVRQHRLHDLLDRAVERADHRQPVEDAFEQVIDRAADDAGGQRADQGQADQRQQQPDPGDREPEDRSRGCIRAEGG